MVGGGGGDKILKEIHFDPPSLKGKSFYLNSSIYFFISVVIRGLFQK